MKTMSRVEVAVYQEPKNGNEDCGDSYFYRETEKQFICALADGLGSGEYAKESSDIVINIIKENIDYTVEEIVKKCNQQLLGKRGAVLAILKIDFSTNSYTISTIGNIGVMTVWGEDSRKRYIPNAGYLAGYKRDFKVTHEPLVEKMNIIMYTDGVKDKELRNNYFYYEDVDRITDSYALRSEKKRDDDTTLIAIRYKG
ncbi:SpoIIE family protein phosphatase [Ornithinibacillus halotolerans]|uniref:Phosphoserine phosphatase RsbX n=1 Tax=Ornithinibacillus halotolerans TaxID=1274357 RepID=A0A916SC13_9BACI|nr:SpoIIE family protein phosphatase [Ornithinibacillus halotolerans]GGA92605.1 phosphoserine phosphatase RsbX [Ornithinibacillus halotolerans]